MRRVWACFAQFLKGPPHWQEFQHWGVVCECRIQAGCYQSSSPEGPQVLQSDWGQLDLGKTACVQISPASLWGLLEVGDGRWQIAPREEDTGRQLAAVWREWKNSDRLTCSSVEGSMS